MPLGCHDVDFEHYDVEVAIKLVRNLGERLIEETKGAVHQFRQEWVDQLIARYRERPGKPIVHLSDLMNSTMVGVGPEATETLRMFWNRLVHQPPKQRPWERLRGIRDYAYGHPSRLPRLSTWKLFGKLAGFDIDDLERHVTMLRTSSGRYTRTVEQVNLPFSLSTIPGARLIGYQGDANSRNAAFSNRDPVLHADYADCVRRVVGEITIRNTNLHRGGFGAGDYARTNVGELVTILVGVAGFDNSLDQKLANNPLPLWLNVSTDSLIAACLSALWDAEGSVNFRDLKLGQAVPLPPQLSKYLPNWPENVPFRQVPVEIQTTISRGPPLLLVSSALFLRRLGIPSHLTPTKASMTSTGPTAYWLLRIHQDESIRTFRRRIGLMSPSKRKSLEAIR